MKVLFIKKTFIVEPLGIMSLSAALKKAGHKTDIVLTNEDVEHKVSQFKPDIICYSVMTGEQKEYLVINGKLKEKFRFISFFGGPHPTFFSGIINDGGVDVICIGEGDRAIVELADALDKHAPYALIPNLWVKISRDDKIEIIKNPMARFPDNLDGYPFPDRELIYKFTAYRDNPIKHFMVSRGCPYDCSYCFNKAYSDIQHKDSKRIRMRSVQNVIREIKDTVSKYPTKLVYFQDDIFLLDKNWLREFAEVYREEINLPYHCHVRANLVTEESIKLLKDSNCYSVHIAAESGDETIRNEVLNRNMTEKEIIKASDILRQYEIKFMIQNMIGLPTETIRDAIKTLELNIKCKPTYAWASIFQPYPGTRIAKFCEEKGLLNDISIDDIHDNFFDDTPFNLPDKHKFINLQRLFAIIVENPILYHTGLYNILIDQPLEKTDKLYKQAYHEFRNRKDNELYGLKLN